MKKWKETQNNCFLLKILINLDNKEKINLILIILELL